MRHSSVTFLIVGIAWKVGREGTHLVAADDQETSALHLTRRQKLQRGCEVRKDRKFDDSDSEVSDEPVLVILPAGQRAALRFRRARQG
jgi:hypothetical protein